MFCLHCGTDIPDGSQFCRKCGQSQTVASTPGGAAAAVAPARIPTTPIPSAPKAKANSNRSVITLIVLLGVLVAGWFAVKHGSNGPIPPPSYQTQPQPQLHTQTLGEGAFTVPAGASHYFKFTAPEGATNVRLQGHFTATGGTGNDVEVWLLTEDGFTNWQNGHATNTLYNSGRVTQDSLNVTLPGAGTYYLVFNNKFSFLTPKAVQANASMTFYTR